MTRTYCTLDIINLSFLYKPFTTLNLIHFVGSALGCYFRWANCDYCLVLFGCLVCEDYQLSFLSYQYQCRLRSFNFKSALGHKFSLYQSSSSLLKFSAWANQSQYSFLYVLGLKFFSSSFKSFLVKFSLAAVFCYSFIVTESAVTFWSCQLRLTSLIQGLLIISRRVSIVIVYFNYFLSLSFDICKLVIWHFLVAIIMANVNCHFLKNISLFQINSYISFFPFFTVAFQFELTVSKILTYHGMRLMSTWLSKYLSSWHSMSFN